MPVPRQTNAITESRPAAVSASAGEAAFPIAPARIVILLALIAGALALLTWQFRLYGDGYMTDDAFISFRYARNLADGAGPVFNPSARVEGYTNFLMILLMAGGMKVGVSPIDSSRAMGIAATAGVFALVPLVAAQLHAAWSWRWWTIVAGVFAALALNTGFALWTFAGLETTMFSFVIVLAVLLHLFEERTGSAPVWSAVALFAGVLLRPDALVIFGTVFGLKALHRATTGLRDARGWAHLARWAAIFGVPFAVYWAWRWAYYGHFMPNTYYLKTGEPFEVLEEGIDYTWAFVTQYAGWLALPALFAAWRERSSAYRPATSLCVIIVVWFVYISYAGGDWMPYFRFYAPLLPLLYIAALAGAVALVDAARPAVARGASSMSWRAGDALPLGAVALFAGALALSAWLPHRRDGAEHPPDVPRGILQGGVVLEDHRAIGLWLRDNLPRDYTMALVAAGIVPYYSRLPTIDLFGVTDEHIAHQPLGPGMPGHRKTDGGYVISRKPEIIWLALGLEAAPRRTVDDYVPVGPLGGPLYDEIVRNPYVWFLYRPVAVPIRDRWLNILVLMDADAPAVAQQP